MNTGIPKLDPIEDEINDKLGYKIGAEKLAQTLTGIETPNCFGIYGVWGSGKTSLMKLTKNYIDKNNQRYYSEHIATVWFDPWRYELEKDVPIIYPLLRQIQNEFKVNKTSARKKIRFVNLNLYILISDFFKAFSKFGIEGIEFPSLKTLNDDIDIANKSVYTDYERWIDKLDMFKNEFNIKLQESLKKAGKKKLFIFIDDMDRCSQENAIQLLEVMKNYLQVDNVLFIIGVDQTVLIEYLDQKYSKKDDPDFGRLYLSKIIPLSLTLPSKNPLQLVEEVLRTNENLSYEMIRLMANYLEEYCHSNRRLMIIIVFKFLLTITYIDFSKFHGEIMQIVAARNPNPYKDQRACYMALFRWCILKELKPDLTTKYNWLYLFEQHLESKSNLVRSVAIGYREGEPKALIPPLDSRELAKLVNSYVEDGLFMR